MSEEELNVTVSNATVDNRIVQLISVSPGLEELVIVPLPDIDDSQNITYVVQWTLFALLAIVGWLAILRTDVTATIA